MLAELMMIAGGKRRTRLESAGSARESSCVHSGRTAGIRDPSQDLVVRRGDLEYQRRMQPQALQSIALAVAEARSVNLVLQRIVEGLAGQPGTALARIWLRGPGDLCSSSCPVRAECPDLLEEEPSLVQVPHAGEAL